MKENIRIDPRTVVECKRNLLTVLAAGIYSGKSDSFYVFPLAGMVWHLEEWAGSHEGQDERSRESCDGDEGLHGFLRSVEKLRARNEWSGLISEASDVNL